MAVAAIKGEKTMIELAHEFDFHPNQNKQGRDQLLEGATGQASVLTAIRSSGRAAGRKRCADHSVTA